MSTKSPQSTPPSGGLIRVTTDYFKLVLRLMADKRVNPLLKTLPIAGVVYFISPLDAFIPLVDDLGIISLTLYMFVEMCPPDIVEEHRQAISAGGTPASSRRAESENDDNVVDAEFRER